MVDSPKSRPDETRIDTSAHPADSDSAVQELTPPEATHPGADTTSDDLFYDDPPLTGSFARYEIEDLIGTGAMGQVYRALDTRLHRPVALKIPSRRELASEADRRRFYREARAAAKLHHPNICTVYDVGAVDGVDYIAMQFIEGRSLAEIIAFDERIDAQRAAVIVAKLAQALAVAHEAGIVHRDLKPANVMIVGKDEPIVMDFGLARHFDDVETSRVTREGMIVGSPAYMSPEQMAGHSIGPATDIYSLGVVLYEMLVGRTPFTGSVMGIAAQVMNDEPASLSTVRSDIPAELEAICQTAIDKSPTERFRSMADFARSLEAFARGESGAATLVTRGLTESATDTLPTVERFRQQQTRRKQLLANVSAALFAIITLGGLAYWATSDTTDQISPNNVATETPVEAVEPAADPTMPEPNDEPPIDPLDALLSGEPLPRRPAGARGPRRLNPELDAALRASDGSEIFSDWDKDGDGFIRQGELPLHIILRADRNGDEQLGPVEYRRAIEERGQSLFRPPAVGANNFPGPRFGPGNRPNAFGPPADGPRRQQGNF